MHSWTHTHLCLCEQSMNKYIYIWTLIQSFTHTLMNTYTHTCISVLMWTKHTYDTYSVIDTHTCIRSYTHEACMYAHTHTQNASMYTLIHAHTHTQSHNTHTHSHNTHTGYVADMELSRAWHWSWAWAMSCRVCWIWASFSSPLLTTSSSLAADSWFFMQPKQRQIMKAHWNPAINQPQLLSFCLQTSIIIKC